jgi:hypothetical protein
MPSTQITDEHDAVVDRFWAQHDRAFTMLVGVAFGSFLGALGVGGLYVGFPKFLVIGLVGALSYAPFVASAAVLAVERRRLRRAERAHQPLPPDLR